MGFIQMFVGIAVIIGILLLGTVGFIYYASSTHDNITVDDQYSGLWSFTEDMNQLVAILLANLGYVLMICLIIFLFVSGILYVAARGF